MHQSLFFISATILLPRVKPDKDIVEDYYA